MMKLVLLIWAAAMLVAVSSAVPVAVHQQDVLHTHVRVGEPAQVQYFRRPLILKFDLTKGNGIRYTQILQSSHSIVVPDF